MLVVKNLSLYRFSYPGYLSKVSVRSAGSLNICGFFYSRLIPPKVLLVSDQGFMAGLLP